MILFAHVKKELLLLARDRVGICVLFLMPMLLVLVLSLVQDSLFRANGETVTKALYINLDHGLSGKTLAEKLTSAGSLKLIDQIAGKAVDLRKGKELVLSGTYQFAIIIPEAFSSKIKEGASTIVAAAVNGAQANDFKTEISLYFDPAVRGVFRSAVFSALQQGTMALEIEEKSRQFTETVLKEYQATIEKQLAIYGADNLPITPPEISNNWANQSQITIKEKLARPDAFKTVPTSVQQNVPAWTLFGMFFIVVPLAGTLIGERQEGTLTRLMTMPVSIFSFLMGKTIAYVIICLLQFALMLLVGRFILPLLGTPILTIGSEPLALLAVALSSGLAACGFGILVGVLAKSYEQASTMGAILVVIAAAVGGVMVPVYVMPQMMQDLSIISPLNWGLNAFLDIFIRNGNLVSVIPNIIALIVFFISCITCALIIFNRQRQW